MNTQWRCLTLPQPHPWSVSFAGCDVINRTWQPSPKLFERETTVYGCHRLGGTIAESYASLRAQEAGESYDTVHVVGCPGSSAEHTYEGMGYYRSTFFEPLWVMIHAGQQWDKTLPKYMDPPFGTMKHSAWLTPTVSALADGHSVIGSTWADGEATALMTPSPFGAVVAVARIDSVHESELCWNGEAGKDLRFCSQWAHAGDDEENPMFHWVLADVQVLGTPVPAKGRQGLWKPSVELVQQVEEQL